jgi:hypothetical protein
LIYGEVVAAVRKFLKQEAQEHMFMKAVFLSLLEIVLPIISQRVAKVGRISTSVGMAEQVMLQVERVEMVHPMVVVVAAVHLLSQMELGCISHREVEAVEYMVMVMVLRPVVQAEEPEGMAIFLMQLVEEEVQGR